MTCRFLCAVCCATVAIASHADVVTFEGEGQSRLVGELKRLERGKLYFKTDATDTIAIEWNHISQLESTQQLQIELDSGERLLGTLVAGSSAPGTLAVRTQNDEQLLRLRHVIEISPIEERFLDRFDGEISGGYSFTKGSDVKQFNLGLKTAYVTEDYEIKADASTIFTRDNQDQSSDRSTAELSTLRLLGTHWAAGALLRFERNDGQGLDLRTSIGVGAARFLRRSNLQNLVLSGALLYNRERIQGTSRDENNFELSLSARYDLFRYDSPEVDISTAFSVLPNLSDSGRVRATWDLSFKWELYEDLFWNLSFYDSFDSDPPAADADRNDYGVVTGLGWDF